MSWSKAGSSSAFTVTIILVLGAGGFALWYSPGEGPADVIPVEAEDVAPPGQSGEFVQPSRTEPVVASAPDTPDEEEIRRPVSLESDDSQSDSQWIGSNVSDTGPFIDADDDGVDYSFSPVSDIGEFLDPDAN